MSKNKEKSTRTAKTIITTVAILLVIIGALGGVIINFVTDYLWFKDLGYVNVFLTKLFSIIKLAVPCLVVLTLLARLYLSSLYKDYHKKMVRMTYTTPEKTVNKVGWGLSIAFGAVGAYIISTKLWYEIMSFIKKVAFGIDDPLFNLDISTYIYTLPLANRLYSMATLFVIMLVAITIIYYVFLFSVRRPQMFNSSKAEEQAQPEGGVEPEGFYDEPEEGESPGDAYARRAQTLEERYAREGENAFRGGAASEGFAGGTGSAGTGGQQGSGGTGSAGTGGQSGANGASGTASNGNSAGSSTGSNTYGFNANPGKQSGEYREDPDNDYNSGFANKGFGGFEKFAKNFQQRSRNGQSPFGSFGGGGNPFGGGGQGPFGGGQNPFEGAGEAVKDFAAEKFTGNWKELLFLALRQVVIIGVIFFLVLGAGFFLKQYGILYNHGSVVYGAGFVDANIYLWMYRILAALSVVSAVLFAVGLTKKKFKLAIACPIIMIAIGVIGVAGGALVHNFIVLPDEISKESPYIANNIAMTQAAYGIDVIEESSFPADTALTAEDIAKNDAIFKNIRINDFEPTEQFYNQRQSIKQYYTFNDVDVDRYTLDGDYCQVFLSAREIDGSNVNSQWITKHLKYTHGYGFTLSKVNSITASGQPDILVQNVPPESSIEGVQIARPEIYFGESTDNYVIVGTKEKEFDYPLGDTNVYCDYEGDSGVSLNPINRVLYAIKEHSLKILVSTNISSKSKILYARNIEERVQKIAPYLTYDSDPYLVVNDSGKLYWMIDAYTTTSNYPYSEPYKDGLNYIRNSIKVVVDAYSGDVDFYVIDEKDPLVKTMAGVFPDLFKPIDQMPEDLYKHIRYPKALFEVQAQMYTKYHMKDVGVFYQGEDQWSIANEIYGQEETKMESNYYIMSLPGRTEEEFVLTISYTPVSKNNMTGLLLARCDGENYGQIKLYRMPKGKTIYGPAQIEAQIDQDPTISKEFSLWSQQGSTYLRGNVFVIPVENSLLYVEPIYLQSSTSSSLPEVKRVIVVYNDRIAYENTLGEALEKLFGTNIGDLNHVGEVGSGSAEGGETGTDTGGDPGTQPEGGQAGQPLSQAEIIQNANAAYDNAIAAQQAGDWAAYGQYIKELEGYLRQLQQ